ncbi:MAG: glycosyltransferase family 39 protein [Deltaproteobacteria bacterium]|nr:glycosyltransferase family 39 protein [Deltaproteobacteria bacterium]
MGAKPRTYENVIVAALVAEIALVVVTIAQRLAFPHDVEWMAGSVLDHAERMRSGLPVYTEPTTSWIPFLYPPLYPKLVALLGGSRAAARLLSLACTAVQVEGVRRIARSLGAPRFWQLVGAALVVACYSYVGWWYDLERSDMLLGALVVGASALLLRDPENDRAAAIDAVVAGALLGAAFFAKQQAVFYVVGAAAGLALASHVDRARSRRVHVALFSATSAAVVIPIVVWLDAWSGGWFSYYVLKMPRAHGIVWAAAPDVFPHDIGRGFAFYGATLAVLVTALRTLRRREAMTRSEAIFASMLAAGFGGAIASRLHGGGWLNVLQPWSSLACAAVAIVASRLQEGRYRVASQVAVLTQVALWAYPPLDVAPTPELAAGTTRFHEMVGELETRGDVLVVGRGHLTRARHFQISALADVARVDGRSPPDLVKAIEERRFAAIIDDVRLPGRYRMEHWPAIMLEDVDDLRAPLLANYFVARRIPRDQAELPMRAPASQQAVYLPRREPLPQGDLAGLKRRQVVEAELAKQRSRALLEGRPEPFPEAEIERLAAPR